MNFRQDAVERIENERRLDSAAAAMATGAATLDHVSKGVLRGDWLGHPLHPALTDLPIGFWTSAFVLDFVGGPRSRPAAQRLIALGVLSVIPTAAAGLVDWHDSKYASTRRVGVIHATCNTTATVLYIVSWRSRRQNHHLRGVLVGVIAAGAATLGGYLGGHLAFASNRKTPTEPQVPSSAPPPEDHELDGLIGA